MTKVPCLCLAFVIGTVCGCSEPAANVEAAAKSPVESMISAAKEGDLQRVASFLDEPYAEFYRSAYLRAQAVYDVRAAIRWQFSKQKMMPYERSLVHEVEELSNMKDFEFEKIEVHSRDKVTIRGKAPVLGVVSLEFPRGTTPKVARNFTAIRRGTDWKLIPWVRMRAHQTVPDAGEREESPEPLPEKAKANQEIQQKLAALVKDIREGKYKRPEDADDESYRCQGFVPPDRYSKEKK